jgi:hypothetical protein
LVELFADSLADTLFGEVALDPRIIGTVLHSRVFPRPTAVGTEVSAGIEVVVDLAGLATAQQRDKSERCDTSKHGGSPTSDPGIK